MIFSRKLVKKITFLLIIFNEDAIEKSNLY